jgi:subtilisin family serine protease
MTIEDVHAMFATSTVEGIPASATYLIAAPEGVSTDYLQPAIKYSNMCDCAEPNYLLETPESEQRSFAIYEGGFGHQEYVEQYALDRIRSAEANAVSTGDGILVAVIDTGIDADHPDLIDNLSGSGYDFVDEDSDPADLPNGLDDDLDGAIDEATGHGTHVAGIIAAAAPDVVILPIRVLDSDGNGTVFNVTQGIYFAMGAGAKVINLSLGLDETVDSIKRAIQAAHEADILIVASAGNRGLPDPYHFPAGRSEVMAIAATDALDHKALFSSFGSHIAVSAPGEGIMSTYWNGGYAIWSGTSMSTPFVAAAGALRLSLLPEGPDEIQHRIEESSYELDRSPYEGELGEGRIDLLSLVLDDD